MPSCVKHFRRCSNVWQTWKIKQQSPPRKQADRGECIKTSRLSAHYGLTGRRQVTDRPRSLWRNRNFLLLWSGQIASWIGTGISQLAFALLTLALSGSPAQAGFVGALNEIPYFILTLPAGVLIDRWDRKRVMLVCEAGRALSLLSIPFVFALGHPSVLQLNI